MKIAIIWYLFCAGILLGTDDGKPWKFVDYLLLLFAGFYVPMLVGFSIGKRFKG